MKKYDLVIIGGGPAGVYTAIFLDKKYKILIIDRNESILKKFLITGRGRSNICNMSSVDKILENNINGTKNFLKYGLYKYNLKDLLLFLDSINIKYQYKENNKVHLISENKEFVSKIMKIINNSSNIELCLNSSVEFVEKNNETFKVHFNNEIIESTNLLIATGGLSFSKFSLNSNTGYKLASSLKHNIIKQYPMGFNLDLKKEISNFDDCVGLALQNVKVTLKNSNKVFYIESGDLMITHKGIGGPIIRRVSGYLSYSNDTLELFISLLDDKQLLNSIKTKNRLNQIWNEFNFIPKRIIKNFYKDLNLQPNTDLKNISKVILNKIINYFCEIKVDYENTNNKISESISTGGGVDCKEIDNKTFMSKLTQNLFFAGEILDNNPKTGGFNLTNCYIAAKCISDYLNSKYNKK